eukprot:m.25987 g.25987  ORF g.25987 m.25987 type:complete len:74 (+) comp8780_c0_seq4:2672-2893(+)
MTRRWKLTLTSFDHEPSLNWTTLCATVLKVRRKSLLLNQTPSPLDRHLIAPSLTHNLNYHEILVDNRALSYIS